MNEQAMNALWHVLSIITGPFIWGVLFGWLTYPPLEAALKKRSKAKRQVIEAEYRRKEE